LVAKSKQQALKHQKCRKKENLKTQKGKKHKQKMGLEKQEK